MKVRAVIALEDRLDLAYDFARIAIRAGRAIERIRAAGATASIKGDLSPVTEADHAAEALILQGLAETAAGIPVVAEEDCARHGVPSSVPRRFILVDPLDGTAEFVDGRADYTVNIALIEDGRPTVGCVLAPADGRIWIGAEGHGAFRGDAGSGDELMPAAARPIIARPPGSALIALESRRCGDDASKAYLDALTVAERRLIGSSVKFALIAEGLADVYVRFGRTMEWDTAAGQAVLTAAGGKVVTIPEGEPLAYGKPGFKNGAFVARGA